jgi:hypothetical protein
MRPKKRILLLDQDETRAGVMAYMLAIHNYFVIRATSVEHVVELFSGTAPDLVLAQLSFPTLGPLLEELNRQDAFVRQVVIAKGKQQCDVVCDAFLIDPPTLVLLEHVRIAIGRKKGPRAAVPDISDRRAQLLNERRSA